jgi:hypothetical protein
MMSHLHGLKKRMLSLMMSSCYYILSAAYIIHTTISISTLSLALQPELTAQEQDLATCNIEGLVRAGAEGGGS